MRSRRFSKQDLAFALAIAVAVAVLCRPYLDASFVTMRGTATDTGDEGTILYDAARMARGHAPYREVFAFRGPYAFLPYVLAFQIGEPSARTGRIAQFAVVALWSGLAYLLGLAVTRRRSLALVAASWPFFVAWPAWAYAHLDLAAQLAAVAATLALLLAERRPDRTARWWIAAAGMFGGVATWTSLAQGATVLIALAGGLVVQSVLAGQPGRAAVSRQAWYWSGFAAATLLAVAWLVPHGAVRAAIDGTLIFPFKYYGSSANVTTYGYDAQDYVGAWVERGRWLGWTVRTCLGGLLLAPALAVIAAVAWVGRLLVRRVGWSWTAFEPGALGACALAAPAIPVLFSRTRSDVCHIGFVVGSCVFVLAAIVAVMSRSRRLFVRVVGAVGFVVLTVAPAAGAALYGYGLHLRAAPGVPIDDRVRARVPLELYNARLETGDTFVATPYGGWHYLATHHDNATSFSLLYEDPYCRGQWEVAAKQIIERKPAFLAMSGTIFELLAGKEPRLRELYFGYDGNYLLDRAKPGPALARKRWALSRIADDGSASSPVPIDLSTDDHLPRLFGDFGGGALRAALYGDRFFLFDAQTTYVGTLSGDGGSIEGRVFSGGTPVGRFRAAAP
jgi:hypothetical protein